MVPDITYRWQHGVLLTLCSAFGDSQALLKTDPKTQVLLELTAVLFKLAWWEFSSNRPVTHRPTHPHHWIKSLHLFVAHRNDVSFNVMTSRAACIQRSQQINIVSQPLYPYYKISPVWDTMVWFLKLECFELGLFFYQWDQTIIISICKSHKLRLGSTVTGHWQLVQRLATTTYGLQAFTP